MDIGLKAVSSVRKAVAEMNKCIASKDGVCQNIYACGLECDGYSSKCKLKPYYDKLNSNAKGIEVSMRKAFGFVSDKGEGGAE